jgi:hypothetical protein
MKRIMTAICTRLERNVVAANDYHIGREDGPFDGLVDKMWENAAHEVARLPMIYAIGADLTGDDHWRELAQRLGAEAAAKSKGESPELKQQWLEVMRLVANRSEGFLARCRDYRAPDAQEIHLDWRTWPLQPSQGYQVPVRAEFSNTDNRAVREPAEAALVLLLCPQRSLSPEQLLLVRQTIGQVDYAKSVWYGLYYTQAVYWRAVRLGVLEVPASKE